MASTASNHVPCGYAGHYHLYMTIAANKQDKANNKTNVTVEMYAKSDSDTYHAYDLTSKNAVKMNVNGKQVVNTSIYMDFREQKTVKLASWTGDIAHDADGKKYLECSGSFTFAGSKWLSGGNIACSINLDSIPRATKPGLSKTLVSLGDAIVIKISPAVSTWTHNIYYRIGTGDWVRFATDVKSNYSWTVPLGIASSYPTATKGTITIGLNTYNGSSQIGGTQTVNLDITIPASVAPSVSAITVSEAASGLSNFGYVQTKSKLKIVASASGSYGSSIRSYAYNIGSQSYSGLENTYTMGEVVLDSGTVAVTVTVTDSRGRTASKTVSITVLAYSPPQITHFECSRCGDVNGSANANGQYLKVTFGYSVSPLNNKNKASYLLKYSVYDDGKWGGLTSGTQYTYSGTYISATAILNTASTYQIGLVVTDSFGTASFYKEIGTAVRLLSYIVKRFAIAIGKIPEKDSTFEVALETVFNRYASFMSGVGIAGDLKAYSNVTVNNWIEVLGNIWINKNSAINVTTEAGNQKQLVSTYGESAFFGYGNYDGQYGDSYLLGKDVFIGINSHGTKIDYRPYYRKGDSVDIRLQTSGYLTNSYKDVNFVIPLDKPVVGSSVASVASINGFILRQNGKYTHGSSASTWVKPDIYVNGTTPTNKGLGIVARFNTTTNAVNNSPIGIDVSLRVTFA